MSIEPQIQYCTTSDGVSQRSAYEWLATRNQLIRFDARNTGLSDRGVEDVSFAAHERDLATVVDRLNLDMLSFYAVGSGNLAITYAAHHPDRVRRMVLVNVIMQFGGIEPGPWAAVFPQLLAADWETLTETAAGMLNLGRR